MNHVSDIHECAMDIVPEQEYTLKTASKRIGCDPEDLRAVTRNADVIPGQRLEEVWQEVMPWIIAARPHKGRVKVEDEEALRKLWVVHGAVCNRELVAFRFKTEADAKKKRNSLPEYPGYTYEVHKCLPGKSIL